MEENASKKSNKKLFISGIIVFIIVACGVVSYISSRAYETTDNAQLDGDLLAVQAGVTGYISQIRFKNNQEVTRGDTFWSYHAVMP